MILSIYIIIGGSLSEWIKRKIKNNPNKTLPSSRSDHHRVIKPSSRSDQPQSNQPIEVEGNPVNELGGTPLNELGGTPF